MAFTSPFVFVYGAIYRFQCCPEDRFSMMGFNSGREIIRKWGRIDGSKEDFLFNILEKKDNLEDQFRKVEQFVRNTNKYIKRICKIVGIDKNVTTDYGRHSAATIMKKSGASIKQIRDAPGYQNTSTTQKYLDSFNDETKRELSRSLTSFMF